ncbi:MAG TPA: DUF2723 domain-containing protein [Caldilineae bacterium]|nr:DUF2723 domain-containing protein [Caldilineae bacterium]
MSPRIWLVVPSLVSFAIYRATLAPDLTWAHHGADGGDLLTAALTGGVPHPSGYPTYLLFLRGFLTLFSDAPAFGGNLFSALSMSLALFFTALSCAKVLKDLSAPTTASCFIAGVVTAIIGLGSTLWSQAVITEVYGLHVLFTALLLYLTVRIKRGASMGGRDALWIGLALGVGLGNHLSLILTVPAIIVYAWLCRLRLSRWALLGLIGGSALGLTVYGYLVYAARSNPPVNWGDPRDLPRLWWLVSGRVYQPLVFGFPLVWLPRRLSSWASLLLDNLTLPGLALALFGLWWTQIRHRGLFGMVVTQAAMFSVYALGYDTADSYVYLIPMYLAFALMMTVGAWVVGTEALRWGEAHGAAACRLVVIGLTSALVALPVVQAWRHWGEMDVSGDREAIEFAKEAFAVAEPNALIITATDQPTFALWYARYGLGMRPDVAIVNLNLYAFDWYRDTIARWHPDIVLMDRYAHPPDFEELLQVNMEVRPVYLAELVASPLGHYSALRKGPLYRLLSPEP